jgi:hypothetical protein
MRHVVRPNVASSSLILSIMMKAVPSSEQPDLVPGATRFPVKRVGLEQGPLSLVGIIGELLGGNISGSDLESRD